jgi:hypothetical protein
LINISISFNAASAPFVEEVSGTVLKPFVALRVNATFF